MVLTSAVQQRIVAYMADTQVRRVPSSIFRVTYVTLDEPVAVTVLGRVIGWYTPVPRPGQEQAAEAPPVVVPGRTGAPDLQGVGAPMNQAAKDRVLRRMAKG